MTQTAAAEPPKLFAPAAPEAACAAATRGPRPAAVTALVGGLLGSRGVWALGDQAVLSLGNFLTSVILIRHWHGSPEAYGQYALVLSAILFLNSLHAALVTYPLTVVGAGEDARGLRLRAKRSLGATLCIWPVLSVGLVAATLAARGPALLPWAAGALLLWQAQETLRRALLARLRHRDALPGDAVSYLGQAALIWLLTRRAGGHSVSGTLSPEAAFFAIGVTSAAALVIQAVQLGVAPGGWAHLRETARDCWRLGRWLLLSALVSAGTVYVGPWTLQGAGGSAAVARFSALATMLNLTNPVTFGVAGLIVPAVAAARRGGTGSAGAVAARYALQGAVLLLPYFAFLALAPRLALRIFYGPGSPYLELTTYLRLFALGWAMAYAVQVCTAVLNGLERGRGTFASTAAGAVANVVLTVPLAVRFGLAGAVWGGILPIAIQLATAAWLVRRAAVARGVGGPNPGCSEPIEQPAPPGPPRLRARNLVPERITTGAAEGL